MHRQTPFLSRFHWHGFVFLLLVAFPLGCVQTGPEIRSRMEWLDTKLKEVEKDGGKLCAPYTFAKAKAQVDYTRLELTQGQHVLADWHLKRAEIWVKQADQEMEPYRKKKELWICRDEEKPKPPPPPPRKIDPCAKDTDSDGIPDCRDLCPNQPEDYQGYEDTDGCPDGERDTDGDGIPDFRDKCPLEPEDRNGYQDDDGCPDGELDTDGDGIPDFRDKCPTVPGVAPDGCPPKKVYKLIVIKDKKIELKQKIFFATARDKIRPVSFPILKEVGAALRDNPEFYVCIEGHTDDRGGKKYNLGLSDRRAASVRRFLIEDGISETRMRSRGYGQDQPIDSNRTKSGRAANRRVEFAIVKPNDPCPRDGR